MDEQQLRQQVFASQLKQLDEHINQVELQKNTLNETLVALQEIKITKEDSNILVPISGGIYIEAKLTNTKEALMNMGSGATVKKTIDEIITDINVEIKKLDQYLLGLIEQRKQLESMFG